MQRHPFKHGIARPGVADLPFLAQPFLDQSSVRGLRPSNDDPQEWNSNCHTLSAGNLCGSGLSPWEIASGRRDRLFCAGIAIASSCSRSSSAVGIQKCSGYRSRKQSYGSVIHDTCEPALIMRESSLHARQQAIESTRATEPMIE